MVEALALLAGLAGAVGSYSLGYLAGRSHRKAHDVRYFMECKADIDLENVDWTGSIGHTREDCLRRNPYKY
jgi:hypothetical protein